MHEHNECYQYNYILQGGPLKCGLNLLKVKLISL